MEPQQTATARCVRQHGAVLTCMGLENMLVSTSFLASEYLSAPNVSFKLFWRTKERESIQSWQAMVVGGPRQALQGQTAARLSQIPPFPANPLVSQKVHVKLGFPLVPAAPTGLHTPSF